MAQHINSPKSPKSPSTFLKFFPELFSTKSDTLKQENAPTHTTSVSPIESIIESFEAYALSPQLKDRTKKLAIPFSLASVRDEADDENEVFEETLEKPGSKSENESEDCTLNSQGEINGDKTLQESDYQQKIETEVRNMFLNAPNAMAQMRGHNVLRRNSLFDNYPLSERRPVITRDDLTEEEMAALWVDIFKPLDVMGMILGHEKKTTSQHGQ